MKNERSRRGSAGARGARRLPDDPLETSDAQIEALLANVKKLRKRSGYQWRQYERITGLSRQVWHRLKKREGFPRLDSLLKFCECQDIPLRVLLSPTEDFEAYLKEKEPSRPLAPVPKAERHLPEEVRRELASLIRALTQGEPEAYQQLRKLIEDLPKKQQDAVHELVEANLKVLSGVKKARAPKEKKGRKSSGGTKRKTPTT